MTKTKKIVVQASGSYDIIIGNGIIQDVCKYLSKAFLSGTAVVVTDDNVDKLYSDVLLNALKDGGYNAIKYVIKAGEGSKNLTTYSKILSFMAENGITRKDFIIALGGGVVGDLSGFLAATYLRGINFIQIPTTLLAQIDSSVGGKTGVDLPEGKNLVGAFKQPKLVLCDVACLSTLPQAVFNDGMGEMVKYALLDKDIFNLFALGALENLTDLIYLSIDYKRKIVEADEFEQSVRKLLNLGHTPAHGVEKLSNYTISHGNAVAMGVKIMVNSALKRGNISQDVYDNIIGTLGKYLSDTDFDTELLAKTAFYDKKRAGDYIDIISVYGIGDCRIERISFTDLKEYF
ncbi:MAG: 3-dehydroquinate synthase [Clostridia bacterium]|nr:3-dehydroquinate synthase [Clostridia bacterium]